MKKITVLLAIPVVLFSITAGSRAELLLNEPFNYANGPLVGNGTWTSHSGGGSSAFNGNLSVTNDQVLLNINAGEDDNVTIPGAPYDGVNNPDVTAMYASFTLNCFVLPDTNGYLTTSGNYFAHFKNTIGPTGGTSDSNNGNGFFCRIFAQQTNAASGMFRLGVGATNAIPTAPTVLNYAQFPVDMATNTTYTVVMFLNFSDGTSRLWVNPLSESDTFAESDQPGSPGAAADAFCLREASSASNLQHGKFYIGNLKIGSSFDDVAGTNQPPTITAIVNQSALLNAPIGPVAFQVGSQSATASSLVVTATSDNTSAVPNDSITFSNIDGTNRTISIAGSSVEGSANITVSVTDPTSKTTTTSFQVTIGAPTISTVAPQILLEGGTPQAISFTVGSQAEAASALIVTGTSSNPSLVPNANITFPTFGGDGTARTVLVTPVASSSGLSTITLSVSDGVLTTPTTFSYTVSPQYGIIFQDNFDEYTNAGDAFITDFYGNPALFEYTGSPWFNHSGTANQLVVTNGMALIAQTNTEDIHAVLVNPPFSTNSFATNSGAILYYGCQVQLTALPGLTGDYFLHFMDTGTDFRGKLFASTTNAAPGFFRFGISNGANAPPNIQINQDLTLNTTYNVVVRYNVGTAITTLWLNPSSESSASVTATDSGQVATPVDWFTMRENTFEGIELIDNLTISTAFNDVVTFSPVSMTATLTDSGVEIAWTTNASPALILQSESAVDAVNWQDVGQTPTVVGASYVVTVQPTSNAAIFRLVHH